MSTWPALFQPIKVGDVQLKHRVVLAPSTRFRATVDGTPNPNMIEYYAQRASTPGTLLIAEATFIARKAGGFIHVPGIWSPEQITAWKKITDAVHAKGSFIFLQLWALGRTAYVEHLAPGDPFVSSSPKKVDTPFHRGAAPRTDDVPRAMTIDEIKEYSQLYATAAANAVHKAGFDGVEVHGANGYLPEQFLWDTANERTDEYGGSIENRARFVLELLDAIAAAVGAMKTAIRLSPWRHRVKNDSNMANPKPTYSYLVKEIRNRHPNFAYLHIIEDYNLPDGLEPASVDFIREIWGNRPLISAGGYSADRYRGFRIAEETGNLIAYSTAFIANPDLPCRLFHDIPLLQGDASKYWIYGTENPSGYTDYAFHDFSNARSEVSVGA
ncbi:NADH:flavin oxidoreductase/NADH oxidase [Mycena sanguinolenta]|uniref:NADH:flavin oxidoreductase/NADH oxidase n=1 Tax=Mycena sanguinolenta TaxID=230812 RepID=A0A8H6ZCL7_9AGAR|nr:NADH:flavin oxidoreductase/NADH oxidase [Mycena sanguinolenta]